MDVFVEEAMKKEKKKTIRKRGKKVATTLEDGGWPVAKR